MSLKAVYVATTEPNAEIIRSMLENAGIPAFIGTDDADGMLPSLDMSVGVAVLVDELLTQDALAVLEEYRRGNTAIDETAPV